MSRTAAYYFSRLRRKIKECFAQVLSDVHSHIYCSATGRTVRP